MAQFKRDRKIIVLSQLTSIHNFSEIRSHGGPPEGEGLRHSMRARDKFVHRWKADRQVGHPVILAGPAQMIGRAFHSTMASTDDIFLCIYCQSI